MSVFCFASFVVFDRRRIPSLVRGWDLGEKKIIYIIYALKTLCTNYKRYIYNDEPCIHAWDSVCM